MSDIPDIQIKKIFKDTIVPVRAFPTDSGLDLYAYRFDKMYLSGSSEPVKFDDGTDKVVLPPGARILVPTGIATTVGEGYEIQIRPRSGLALKNGLTVLNTPGTIDEAYRGEVCVIIINFSGIEQVLTKDMKIAQMVVCPVVLSSTLIVEDLNDTTRSTGGFGHTGV